MGAGGGMVWEPAAKGLSMGFNVTEWSMRAYLRFVTRLRGERVGEDADGNAYYQARKVHPLLRRKRRWVVFDGGESEASRVPPEWHAWLHFQTDQVPSDDNPLRRGWQKPHQANATGTMGAYRPPGHTLMGGRRDRATGDYEPWVPS